MKYEQLGNIIDVSKGKKYNSAEIPSKNSKRIIGIDDLRNDTNIVLTNDQSGVEAYANDILIAWDGANAGTIGYGKKGYIGSTIARLRIKSTQQYNEVFLGKFLHSKFRFFRAMSTGATIPHVNRAALDSIKVPQFNINDQIRIATVLTRAEKLIAKRKESIKAMDEFLKSTFLEMFGLNNTDYKKWKLEPLSASTEIVSGVTKGKKYGYSVLRAVPYMRVANVQDGHLNLSEIKTIEVTENEIRQYELKKGDLLLTEGGDPDKLGRGAVWNDEIDECIHQNHIFRVRAKDASINPVFLSALMASKYGKSYFLKAAKQTTGIASINSTQLKAFPLIKPPPALQNQFASIVTKVESRLASGRSREN
jgi:type I restriction enzyme S subunit